MTQALAQGYVPAWTYNGPFPVGLRKSTIKVPSAAEAKKAKQVLVDVKAAALNPVDIQLMNVFGSKKSDKGIGFDFSGTIREDYGDFVKGDEVMGFTSSPAVIQRGTLAHVAVLDRATTAIVKKPAAWSFEQAAAIPLVWLTAEACIESVESYVAKSGDAKLNVVVLGGSSATGIYTIMLAKKRGWNVLTTTSARNKEFVTQSLEVDQHVDYTTENVRKAVEAFEPTAIIDCVGGTDCIGIRGNARYVSIVGDKVSRATMGGPYTYYDWRAPLTMLTQWIRWFKGYIGLGESYDVVHLAVNEEQLEHSTKVLYPENIYIDKVFDFDDAQQAFERLNTGRARGKVVVRVSS